MSLYEELAELYGLAMHIKDQLLADALFGRIVAAVTAAEPALAPEEIEENVRANLGYMAGYYTDETRRRVEKLFKCEHPIFGPIAVNGPPTAEEAPMKPVFIEGEAPGAIRNGTLVEKCRMEQGDRSPIGTKGRILSSLGPVPDVGGFGYFVEWENLEGIPVFVHSSKIRPL